MLRGGADGSLSKAGQRTRAAVVVDGDKHHNAGRTASLDQRGARNRRAAVYNDVLARDVPGRW
jgi:hypothetical protein